MAAYETGQETVTRIRYRLRTPTNGVELSKMITAAAQERCTQLGYPTTACLSDDALTVDVGDDEVIVWWEVTASTANAAGE